MLDHNKCFYNTWQWFRDPAICVITGHLRRRQLIAVAPISFHLATAKMHVQFHGILLITDSHYIWSLRYKINVWMFQKNWNCYDFYKEGLWSKIYACFWKKLMLKPCILVACVNHTWEQLKSCLVSLSSRQPFVQTDNNISVLFSNTVLWWV